MVILKLFWLKIKIHLIWQKSPLYPRSFSFQLLLTPEILIININCSTFLFVYLIQLRQSSLQWKNHLKYKQRFGWLSKLKPNPKMKVLLNEEKCKQWIPYSQWVKLDNHSPIQHLKFYNTGLRSGAWRQDFQQEATTRDSFLFLWLGTYGNLELFHRFNEKGPKQKQNDLLSIGMMEQHTHKSTQGCTHDKLKDEENFCNATSILWSETWQ